MAPSIKGSFGAVALGLLLLVGCGPKADATKTADAQASFDAAMKAFDDGDSQAAITEITTAIEIGGLSPDQFGEGRIKRAISYARTGDFAAAHADLDIAEQGAALDEVQVARSYVFHKEGKRKESTQAMAEAKKLNRLAKPIKD